MSDPENLTVVILREIRGDLKDLRNEVARTNERLDQTNGRLDQTNERLDLLSRRVVESEIRMSTAITELAGNVHQLTDYLRSQSELRPRVERCEIEIDAIKKRLPG
jgi:chromosome segregation ATPase